VGLLALGQNESKAAGFSITFGGRSGYYGPITAAIIPDTITTLTTTVIARSTLVIITITVQVLRPQIVNVGIGRLRVPDRYSQGWYERQSFFNWLLEKEPVERPIGQSAIEPPVN
jgi:hypothetical protein